MNKHKRQRVFVSTGSFRRPMGYKHRMIWTDDEGYFYYKTKRSVNGQTKICWQNVSPVISDIWVLGEYLKQEG